MSTQRDALVDAGREGFESGRIFERNVIADWLREQSANRQASDDPDVRDGAHARQVLADQIRAGLHLVTDDG